MTISDLIRFEIQLRIFYCQSDQKSVLMFGFFSSASAAVKIIEFLLDKTIWKYFDKEGSSKSIESSSGGGQVLLLKDLVLKKDVLKSSSIELISINE